MPWSRNVPSLLPTIIKVLHWYPELIIWGKDLLNCIVVFIKCTRYPPVHYTGEKVAVLYQNGWYFEAIRSFNKAGDGCLYVLFTQVLYLRTNLRCWYFKLCNFILSTPLYHTGKWCNFCAFCLTTLAPGHFSDCHFSYPLYPVKTPYLQMWWFWMLMINLRIKCSFMGGENCLHPKLKKRQDLITLLKVLDNALSQRWKLKNEQLPF